MTAGDEDHRTSSLTAMPKSALPLSSHCPEISARRLLIACTDEAGLLAAGIVNLDHILAAAIGDLPAPMLQALQLVDLLRQQAMGLAELLALVSDADIAPRRIDGAQILAASPLQKQRQRIYEVEPSAAEPSTAALTAENPGVMGVVGPDPALSADGGHWLFAPDSPDDADHHTVSQPEAPDLSRR